MQARLGSVAGAGNAPNARQRRGTSQLVGRDTERSILSGLLDAASEGRGGVGVVVGEAGIGKSRLLDALATEATDRGMMVLRGRAVEVTTPVAYRPVAEALCSLVRRGRGPPRAGLAPFDHLLAALIPDWRDPERPVLEPSVVVVAEAVIRFLRATAGPVGCLLVLEDLHWADPETSSILDYLVDNLLSERVLCAASWRTDEPTGLAARWRGLPTSRAETVLLDRLDDSAVASMVASCLDAASVGDDILELVGPAEGIPFLVEEVLETARRSGVLTFDGHRWCVSSSDAVVPPPFVDDVRRRLVEVGDNGRTVVVAGALLGRRFEWHLLPATTGLDDAATVAALRDAVALRLVEVDDASTFRFRHALSRDAVLSNVLPPERADLAGRALGAIEAAHPGLDGEWCERAAALAIEAGDRGRAPELLLDAGRRALASGALLSAESALERGREAARPDDPILEDLEECLVEATASIGNRRRAHEVGQSLLRRLGDGPDNATRRAGVELRLARSSVTACQWDEAEAHVGAARRDAVGAEDTRQLSEADALDALIALGRDRPADAVGLARRAHDAALRVGLPRVACEALEVVGRCARVDDLDAAELAFAESHDLAEREGLTIWRLRALHELGTIDMLRNGDLGRLEAARELATATGALATAAMIDVQLCGVLVGRDDPEPAVAVARRAGDIARRLSLGQTLAVALGFEANAHARAGRPAAAERCLTEAATYAEDDPSVHVFAACARTVTALLDDDRETALSHVEGVAHDARFFSPLIGWWVLLHALDPQRGEAAVAVVRESGEPAHYLARPYFTYAEAVVLGRAGHRDAAATKMARADALLDGFEWYRQDAHRFVAEAALADGWGDPVGWAREALAFFESWGHDRLAASCRTLLRQAGAPVPRRGRGGAEVPPELGALRVTSREVDVLALVAAGLSNREVAERLVLSVRTVENHVERLLAKTGSPGRAALADVAARAGVTNEVVESP